MVLALFLAGAAVAESDRVWCNMQLSSDPNFHNAYVEPGPVAGVTLVKCEDSSTFF